MGLQCSNLPVPDVLKQHITLEEPEPIVMSADIKRSPSTRPRFPGPGHERHPAENPEMRPGEPHIWYFEEKHGYQIICAATNTVAPIEVDSREEAITMLKESPQHFFGCQWFNEGWGDHKASIFLRTAEFFKEGVQEESPEAYCIMLAWYKQLETEVEVDEPEGPLATFNRNEYSWRCPGRLQGVSDIPGLTIVGNIDPFDITQGSVPDHWLLAAFSSIAEFGPGTIKKLFENTPNLDNLPANELNRYTVTLYDLQTWWPVDVVVDEQLPWDETKWCLLGCRPTRTGELWPCILEKAVAKHCGGWDNLRIGKVVHAWRLLLGCKEVYTITNAEGNGYTALGIFNPNKRLWESLANSPTEPGYHLWPMAWPKVGGGGKMGQKLTEDALFKRMCAWEDANYMMCALRVKHSERDHQVGFTYTVRQILNNCAGSGYDLFQLRAHRGVDVLTSEGWHHGGPKWNEFPAVFRECGEPAAHDDGLFWLERVEFFRHFQSIFLCAMDMQAWAQSDH